MINLNSSIYIQEISNFFIIFLIVLKFLFEWLEKKKKKKKKKILILILITKRQ